MNLSQYSYSRSQEANSREFPGFPTIIFLLGS